MPITTFLHDSELDQPSGHPEIDQLVAEVRKRTGRNYQVVTHRWGECYGYFRLRRRVITRMGLFVEVGGVGPWQWLSSTQTAHEVRAYLLGILNGLDDAERQGPKEAP